MSSAKEYLTVRSVAILPNLGQLPTLIEDVRATAPVIESPEGNVYVKPPAFPYTPSHLLIVPDRVDGKDMPGVADGDIRLLQHTLATTVAVAEQVIKNTNAETIDIGWNYSRFEPAKHIASQRRNLHLHVVGYEDGDLYPVKSADVYSDPIQRSKLSEPMTKVGHEILKHKIIPQISGFSRYFDELAGSKSLTFKLRDGLNSISEVDFAHILQELHVRSANEYKALSDMFYKPVRNSRMSATSRPVPLTKHERQDNIWKYTLDNSDWISLFAENKLLQHASEVKPYRQILAENAKALGRKLSDDEVRHLLYAKAGLIGLAYSAVLSARVNPDRTVEEWYFGFDPVVYSSRDLLQASRVQFKLFSRDPQANLTDVQYARLRSIDQAVRKELGP